MHLPDGLLDAKTALLSTGAAAAGLGVALRRVRTLLEPRQTPMLGLAAAFVFAAQMVNFPVAHGTSGHLVGGVLLSILLGPSAAVIVMTCVLLVQCLMFADGGLTALGANMFNMAIASGCGGYLVFRLLKNLVRMDPTRGIIFAAAFAGWFGTVLGSISCAGQLAMSGIVPWSIAFPAMAGVHMLIGIGEGLATGLVVMAVLRARPQMLESTGEAGIAWRGFLAYGLLLCFGLAVFVAPFACSWPDGLETVARALGFEGHATAPALQGPLADYRVPWLGSPTLATAVAGVIGLVLAFVAAYLLARTLAPVLSNSKKDASSGH